MRMASSSLRPKMRMQAGIPSLFFLVASGGNGGSASGIAAVYLAPTLDTNQVYTLQGGRGGDSLGPTNGGRGGDAIGIVAGLVRNGVSLADTISGVTKGAAGTGPPVQASYANGYYLVGNRTLTIRFTF